MLFRSVANGIAYVPVPEYGLVYALDAATGILMWKYEVYNGGAVASPIVANGVAYIPSVTGGFGSGVYTIQAVDAGTGAFLWEYMSAGIRASVIPTPVVVNGRIYCSFASSNVTGVGAFGLPNQ